MTEGNYYDILKELERTQDELEFYKKMADMLAEQCYFSLMDYDVLNETIGIINTTASEIYSKYGEYVPMMHEFTQGPKAIRAALEAYNYVDERLVLGSPLEDRWQISQHYGERPEVYNSFGLPGHDGTDWAVPVGEPVFACASGKIVGVYLNPNHVWGINVRIDHKSGYQTIYAHLSRVVVKIGDSVVKGDIIGKSGNTGNSTGPHLHLTLKRHGATERGETDYPFDIINPEPFFE